MAPKMAMFWGGETGNFGGVRGPWHRYTIAHPPKKSKKQVFRLLVFDRVRSPDPPLALEALEPKGGPKGGPQGEKKLPVPCGPPCWRLPNGCLLNMGSYGNAFF